ncbi:unnamed protein product [Schistosoma margrebowiei]|uniref:G-protein coupled receptors family 1 profile domain-containing protein n=1 Tax=Schistosoma margrebowiei TaxID=48269 RepID=A0AA85AJD5_9TREM|nr:unnamed protein product [Schistosoma margrebowiei]
MHNINSNNNNNLKCSSFNFLYKKWSDKRNSHGSNGLLSNQSSIITIPNETINKITMPNTITTIPSSTKRSFSISNPPLNKYPSSISLLKFNHHPYHHGSIHYHTPRSRRQRRYLRGLLGLSISNLSLSICLLSWCICQIIIYNINEQYYILNAWLTIISLINIWTIDIAQTLEIGAILWIALERTLGIHWPSEIQTMNNNNNNTDLSMKCNLIQCKFSLLKNMFKKCTLHNHFNSSSSSSSSSSPCCCCTRLFLNQSSSSSPASATTSPLATTTTTTTTINKKYREKQKSIIWFLRVILCLLPLILFILASIYSLMNIIQQIKKHKLLYHQQLQYEIQPQHQPQQQQQQPQQQQYQIDIISKLKTTYITHNSSINNDHHHNNNSYIQYFNSLVVYNYYIYITNNLFTKKHTFLSLHKIHIKYQTYVYYTKSIIPALIIGQFLAPLAILITTNLLIYQKVSSRDKRFFSRQSSNTSKSSFISGTSISSINSPTQRKLTTTTINFPIPLLRVLESSNQDIRINLDDDNNTTTNNNNDNTSEEYNTLINKPFNDHLETKQSISNLKNQKQNTLLVPFIDINENSFQYSSIKNLSNTTPPPPPSPPPPTTTMTTNSSLYHRNNSSIDNNQKYLFNERRNSTSIIQPMISYNEFYENNSNITLTSKRLLTTTTTNTMNTTHNSCQLTTSTKTSPPPPPPPPPSSSSSSSTSTTTTTTTTTSPSYRFNESNIKLSTMYTIQKRRKSTNDILNLLFQSRTTDFMHTKSTTDESILIQVLRRQHKRTLRILIILLLIFIICRGPRSFILIIQWLQYYTYYKNQYQSYLYTWLQYTSIFSYSSAILDTILYGFWGNRIYRLYIKHLYTHCALYKCCINQ